MKMIDDPALTIELLRLVESGKTDEYMEKLCEILTEDIEHSAESAVNRHFNKRRSVFNAVEVNESDITRELDVCVKYFEEQERYDECAGLYKLRNLISDKVKERVSRDGGSAGS